ncbi:hypothetical protein PIB30_004462 [Stylosanthes scabra]|uniref:DUF4283 domain-containing protein n=1 Tax=Stylosanthes scabra TaxID=79078 RepID=A0ABU6W3N4_9FABA|nr:hypothetical protein [Stylosanthes scabra]
MRDPVMPEEGTRGRVGAGLYLVFGGTTMGYGLGTGVWGLDAMIVEWVEDPCILVSGNGRLQNWKKGKQAMKWVPVKRSEERGTITEDEMNRHQEVSVPTRKEVQGVWAEDQMERLQRSLLGVCVQPIQFRRVMNHLLGEWPRPGSIECRDVGPYRCLITFSSSEIRDAALNNDLLLSSFDEVIPH